MHRALAGVLTICVTLLLAEGVVRIVSPTPRAQIIRAGAQRGLEVEVREGVPLWYHEQDAPRRNRDCLQHRPDAPRVLFLGDSIFAGISVPPDQVWTRRLEALWPHAPVPCFINLAEPGFSFQQELQLATESLDHIQPDLMVVEWWSGSLWDYATVGESAYRMADVRVDATGVPNPWLTPAPMHAWLMQTSRLYEYASLAIAIPLEVREANHHRAQQSRRYMDAFAALADEHGAAMMLAYPPTLNLPFATHAGKREFLWEDSPEHPGATSASWARDRGMGVVLWDRELADRGEDYLELRLDSCCHFNEAGQAVLAEIMLPHLVEALQPQGG